MITQHVSRSRIGRLRELAFIGAAIGICGGLGLFRFHWQPLAAEMGRPLLSWAASLSEPFASLGYVVTHFKDIPRQTEALTSENRQLKEQMNQMAYLQQENQRLKSLLAIPMTESYHAVSARVIARSPDHWFARLQLNVGSRAQIPVNSAVVNQSGLVGKVIEVSPTTSLVQLVSDPKSAVACLTARGRYPGVLSGLYREAGSLKYLQNYSHVETGEKLYTSGLGEVFPRGILVGTVMQVERTKNQPVPEVHVKLSALQQAVEEVLILVPQM